MDFDVFLGFENECEYFDEHDIEQQDFDVVVINNFLQYLHIFFVGFGELKR